MSVMAFAKTIKVSHTVFSLPFALAAAILATEQAHVRTTQLVLIVAAVLFARAAAMGFNRIVDRHIDAKNPRTATREIPAGELGVRAAWAYTVGAALAFVGCAALLGPATLALAPVALLVVFGYSLTKRFTALCHLVLGLALALAPTGVWIALTGGYGVVPLLLSVAVATWVAGFDILYACQDAAFDKENGLYSIPSRLGVGRALVISAVLHGLTVLALAALPAATPLGPIYGVGVLAIAAVLVVEHAIVRPSDLSRLNKAFFDLNGYISLLYLGSVALSVGLRG